MQKVMPARNRHYNDIYKVKIHIIEGDLGYGFIDCIVIAWLAYICSLPRILSHSICSVMCVARCAFNRTSVCITVLF